MAVSNTGSYYTVIIIDKDSDQLEGTSEFLVKAEAKAIGVAEYIQEKQGKELRASNKKVAVFKVQKNNTELIAWFA